MTDTLIIDSPQSALLDRTPTSYPDAHTGAPTQYTDEIAQEILDRLADGESLAAICRDKHITSRATVYNWLDAHPAFLDRYVRVRKGWQAESLADNVLDISNTEADPRVAKVKIDAAIWVAGKLSPKKYGDTKHINMEHTVKLSEEQLDARLKALANEAGLVIDAECEDVSQALLIDSDIKEIEGNE